MKLKGVAAMYSMSRSLVFFYVLAGSGLMMGLCMVLLEILHTGFSMHPLLKAGHLMLVVNVLIFGMAAGMGGFSLFTREKTVKGTLEATAETLFCVGIILIVLISTLIAYLHP